MVPRITSLQYFQKVTHTVFYIGIDIRKSGHGVCLTDNKEDVLDGNPFNNIQARSPASKNLKKVYLTSMKSATWKLKSSHPSNSLPSIASLNAAIGSFDLHA